MASVPIEVLQFDHLTGLDLCNNNISVLPPEFTGRWVRLYAKEGWELVGEDDDLDEFFPPESYLTISLIGNPLRSLSGLPIGELFNPYAGIHVADSSYEDENKFNGLHGLHFYGILLHQWNYVINIFAQAINTYVQPPSDLFEWFRTVNLAQFEAAQTRVADFFWKEFRLDQAHPPAAYDNLIINLRRLFEHRATLDEWSWVHFYQQHPYELATRYIKSCRNSTAMPLSTLELERLIHECDFSLYQFLLDNCSQADSILAKISSRLQFSSKKASYSILM